RPPRPCCAPPRGPARSVGPARAARASTGAAREPRIYPEAAAPERAFAIASLPVDTDRGVRADGDPRRARGIRRGTNIILDSHGWGRSDMVLGREAAASRGRGGARRRAQVAL